MRGARFRDRLAPAGRPPGRLTASGHPRGRRAGRLGVPAVLALGGLLFATSAGMARGTDLRPGERGDLVELIRSEQTQVSAESARVTGLRAQVEAGTRAAGRRDPEVEALQAHSERLAGTVGLQPVRGPGLSVTLDDAPAAARAAAPPGTAPDDLVVHQQDVQAVVNALWDGGAEALQVMDQRVISTSAVRCVGNTLILHGQVYPPPYAIRAIGPVDQMQAALDRAPALRVYRQYVDLLGLRYDVRRAAALTLPGYTGSLDLLHARTRVPAGVPTAAGTVSGGPGTEKENR